MSSLKNELLGFIFWSSINLAAPLITQALELEGSIMLGARFIWLASGLRSLLHLENMRALALGRDLSSSEHGRDLFKLALVYVVAMILMAAGGVALII